MSECAWNSLLLISFSIIVRIFALLFVYYNITMVAGRTLLWRPVRTGRLSRQGLYRIILLYTAVVFEMVSFVYRAGYWEQVCPQFKGDNSPLVGQLYRVVGVFWMTVGF